MGTGAPRCQGDRRSWHGQTLAAMGGAGLLGSLWLPWYIGRIPQGASAWQTFTALPAVLLVTGTFAGVLSLLQLSQRAGDTSRLAIVAGVLATILVGYRLSLPPVAGLHPAWGLYLGLGSAVSVLGGGVLASANRPLPEIAMPVISLGGPPAPGLPAPPAP